MQPQAVSLINPPNMIYNSNFLSFYLKPVVVSLTSPSFIHPYLNSQFHHVNSFWSFPQVLPYDLFTSWPFFPSLSVSSPEVWVLSSFLALDLGGGGGRFLDFNRDFFFLFLFRAAHEAYRSSQARDQIGATAAGLCHSHSNAGSKPRLRPTPSSQQNWILNPLSKARNGICILMDTCQACYRWATTGTSKG